MERLILNINVSRKLIRLLSAAYCFVAILISHWPQPLAIKVLLIALYGVACAIQLNNLITGYRNGLLIRFDGAQWQLNQQPVHLLPSSRVLGPFVFLNFRLSSKAVVEQGNSAVNQCSAQQKTSVILMSDSLAATAWHALRRKLVLQPQQLLVDKHSVVKR